MRLIATTAMILLSTAPAMAQGTDPIPRAMAECAVIARDAERLACYDAAIAQTSPQARAITERRAKESARIAAEEAAIAAAAARARAETDRLAAAEARRNAFGAETVTTRGGKRFEGSPDEIRTIDTTIAESFKNRDGFSVFLLENGQLWREVDLPTTLNTRAGDKVMLQHAPLGGYKMNFARLKREILVKRMK